MVCWFRLLLWLLALCAPVTRLWEPVQSSTNDSNLKFDVYDIFIVFDPGQQFWLLSADRVGVPAPQ